MTKRYHEIVCVVCGNKFYCTKNNPKMRGIGCWRNTKSCVCLDCAMNSNYLRASKRDIEDMYGCYPEGQMELYKILEKKEEPKMIRVPHIFISPNRTFFKPKK